MRSGVSSDLAPERCGPCEKRPLGSEIVGRSARCFASFDAIGLLPNELPPGLLQTDSVGVFCAYAQSNRYPSQHGWKGPSPIAQIRDGCGGNNASPEKADEEVQRGV